MKGKYYLFYENGNFKGFTDDKKLRDRFLKIRGNGYKTISIPKKRIENFEEKYESCRLTSHNGFDFRYPIFEYEWDVFEPIIREQALSFDESLRDLLFRISYMKLEEDEIKFLKQIILELIETIEIVVNTDHDVILDEVLDMEKYLRYLNRESIYPNLNSD